MREMLRRRVRVDFTNHKLGSAKFCLGRKSDTVSESYTIDVLFLRKRIALAGVIDAFCTVNRIFGIEIVLLRMTNSKESKARYVCLCSKFVHEIGRLILGLSYNCASPMTKASIHDTS